LARPFWQRKYTPPILETDCETQPA